VAARWAACAASHDAVGRDRPGKWRPGSWSCRPAHDSMSHVHDTSLPIHVDHMVARPRSAAVHHRRARFRTPFWGLLTSGAQQRGLVARGGLVGNFGSVVTTLRWMRHVRFAPRALTHRWEPRAPTHDKAE
jgi:hypothetical protein